MAAINIESVRDMTGRLPKGHPATLHPWWARRPLPACRAVIFASMVDDPGDCPVDFPTEAEQRAERYRLHRIIEQLVVWKNIDDEGLIAEARWEIARSVARARGEAAPDLHDPAAVLRYLENSAVPLYDPFCGRGSIPIEGQRLGLRTTGTDLNPIAVLITKALIELPPRFQHRSPVNPDSDPMGMTVGRGQHARRVGWRGSAGLADDIQWYGRWMREEANRRIGHLYPRGKLSGGNLATVTAWLWARTIPCSNPACRAAMPLLSTFRLSSKKGHRHWIRPTIDTLAKTAAFVIQDTDDGVPDLGTVNDSGASCIVCGNTSGLDYVRSQAAAGAMGEQMTAIVADYNGTRLFLPSTPEQVRAAAEAQPRWFPEQKMPSTPDLVSGRGYGITHWHQLFTKRQLCTMTTLSDLLEDVRSQILDLSNDQSYADAVRIYLALAVSKAANKCSSFCRWRSSSQTQVTEAFSRQALPMVWDFAETNPLMKSGVWDNQVDSVANAVEGVKIPLNAGRAFQEDASKNSHKQTGPVIVTDPPYYDNINYASLSDFFYVWLRPGLRSVLPDLFAGISTPKGEEMVADASRFEDPRKRFEESLDRALQLIREQCSPEFPSSIFYAYKQQEEEREGRTSTGWETMLSALVSGGFRIVGTWPIRTENQSRANAIDTNSLASSVVLVCRPRPENAPRATRREFLDALDTELPDALNQLTREGHIAPVDLAQAAIGPGMKVYSRYSRVETIAGEPVTVREALGAINRSVAEYHRREQGNLDALSRFCIDWLREYGYASGAYGDGEGLARAMNVSLSASVFRRLLTSERGEVQLLPPEAFGPAPQLPLEGISAWEGCFRMAYHLDTLREDGEGLSGAARVAIAMGSAADSAERLARILYEHFDSKDDSRNAVRFNNLVSSWPDIERAMLAEQRETQGRLMLQL